MLLLCEGVMAQPTISSLSATSGVAGASVVIHGTNFNTTPANNEVYFGATKATVTAATTTSLTATVPLGATFAPVSVLNTSTSLQAYSNKLFLPTYNNIADLPDTVNFNTQVTFKSGLFPQAVTIYDIDGDGKPDIIIADEWGDSVSILRNISATGTMTSSSFAPRVSFAAGSQVYGLTIGDIDGDGKPDIVVTNESSNTVSILRNTSISGSISFATQITDSLNGQPTFVALGDFDGDGRIDMAVAINHFSVYVFKNTSSTGSISFATPWIDTVNSSPSNYDPYSVSIADMDGDGKLDLVITKNNLGFNVLRNISSTGTIAFAAPYEYVATVDYFSGQVSIADLDGDGKPDFLASRSQNPSFWMMRNTSSPGSLSFAAEINFQPYFGMNIGGANFEALGDLDGDGKPDLVFCTEASDGVSFVAVCLNTSSAGSVSFASTTHFAAGNDPLGVAIGDLNGDGKPDLVVTNYNDTTISVFANDPLPAVITGYPGVCLESTTTLHYSVTGGTWSSSNTSIATVGGDYSDRWSEWGELLKNMVQNRV